MTGYQAHLGAVLVGLSVTLAFAKEKDVQPLPDARALLDACVKTMPDIPLRVTGELKSRDPDSGAMRRIAVDMTLDWHTQPATAMYTARGELQQHLGVTWYADKPPLYRFFRGVPLVAVPLPPLTETIEGTDATWMDLTLAYLWWPGGHTLGEDEVRGRESWVVEIPAPTNHFAAAAAVKLWLDKEIGAVLRAQVMDGSSNLVRRVDIKGFKKINDRWFVKDVEIQSLPGKHTTNLRVRDVEDQERKQFIKIDAGGPDDGESDTVTPVQP